MTVTSFSQMAFHRIETTASKVAAILASPGVSSQAWRKTK
jgi:hypothetical protein